MVVMTFVTALMLSAPRKHAAMSTQPKLSAITLPSLAFSMAAELHSGARSKCPMRPTRLYVIEAAGFHSILRLPQLRFRDRPRRPRPDPARDGSCVRPGSALALFLPNRQRIDDARRLCARLK